MRDKNKFLKRPSTISTNASRMTSQFTQQINPRHRIQTHLRQFVLKLKLGHQSRELIKQQMVPEASGQQLPGKGAERRKVALDLLLQVSTRQTYAYSNLVVFPVRERRKIAKNVFFKPRSFSERETTPLQVPILQCTQCSVFQFFGLCAGLSRMCSSAALFGQHKATP